MILGGISPDPGLEWAGSGAVPIGGSSRQDTGIPSSGVNDGARRATWAFGHRPEVQEPSMLQVPNGASAAGCLAHGLPQTTKSPGRGAVTEK